MEQEEKPVEEAYFPASQVSQMSTLAEPSVSLDLPTGHPAHAVVAFAPSAFV